MFRPADHPNVGPDWQLQQVPQLHEVPGISGAAAKNAFPHLQTQGLPPHSQLSEGSGYASARVAASATANKTLNKFRNIG